MPLLRSLVLRGLPLSVVLATGTFFYTIRHTEKVPLTSGIDTFTSQYYTQYNPNNNPAIYDLHIRRIPISQVDPTLLQHNERLLERYCGGVWAGLGFAFQRNLLTWLSKNQVTSKHQLWSPKELRESEYNTGTVITDEFIVLDKTQSSILIRGGDKVTKTELRPLDGLIELSAVVKPEEDVVELRFKSIFFQGEGKTSKMPMPTPIVWLHEQYARAMLESGAYDVLKTS
ncbi:hypothetical protein ASPZODRAFT_67376 [Penicilliopsis zonata CBS 506.65]|uniref:Uncharacterized protein n=1 Tax=Penicilliopsis zonata CBS 506.65 TaxID=1073090 RepID=A0A1L9SFN2_9EURO|nr:hypothetical protein ASPZODRAFT_67376 [Penicilliopsis zonata CBS 506.65]OJJ45976.1 hypothetical protein ASPZODRAFT_67376 [Penicilliopsis zonata CBS 506.65]